MSNDDSNKIGEEGRGDMKMEKAFQVGPIQSMDTTWEGRTGNRIVIWIFTGRRVRLELVGGNVALGSWVK